MGSWDVRNLEWVANAEEHVEGDGGDHVGAEVEAEVGEEHVDAAEELAAAPVECVEPESLAEAVEEDEEISEDQIHAETRESSVLALAEGSIAEETNVASEGPDVDGKTSREDPHHVDHLHELRHFHLPSGRIIAAHGCSPDSVCRRG